MIKTPCKFFHSWSKWGYEDCEVFKTSSVFNYDALRIAFNNPWIRVRECSSCGTFRMDLFENKQPKVNVPAFKDTSEEV